MFRHAVLALDVNSQGLLLDCVPDLRSWGVSRLTLLHFIHVGYAQGPGLGDLDRHRATLTKEAERLRSPELAVDARVATAGDVGGEIARLAEAELGADLLVIGNREQNVVEKLFLGSVARKVLKRAALPVLVQWSEPPGEFAAGPCELLCANTLRHVLLATDLSSGSRTALDAAVALAARGAHIDCVYVAEQSDVERFPDWETMSRAALAIANERIVAAGGTGDVIVDRGDPLARIPEIAARLDASLLIVGKRGRSWPGQVTMGRTSRALSKAALRPVRMVPSPLHSLSRSAPVSASG